uniref:NADH dehydrogenase subunit 3 n=1 Tax=Leptophlebia marginata TaxID=551854 RepID=UPI001EDF42A1|nr:NADH dehydrogenase subunit 3 [Leptophlebia marginata]YP_010261365.1 NADH dehydrogenase subunit 3 [Leptophlebia vespertina]UIB40259.1 NADH dehydrogenase subunit 3 [Leptophlebia marginata]UIB40272.1 NADH dehydrogenase subunit 3 [Leptophlebia vespertina]
MMVILSTALILITITTMVMILASLLSKKSTMDREKCSPFECGFDPKSSSRLPFSLRFFLIAVIFLIFDVEIALLLPLIILFSNVNITSWFLVSIFFLSILLMGLYHEWNQGALGWAQ